MDPETCDVLITEAGRQVIFSLPPRLYYPFLVLFLRLAPKIAEQTIQGRRWFRLKTPCPR